MISSLLLLAAASRSFFVSPTGDDAADGRSAAHAWRSLARLARESLAPGDTVLLSGTLEGRVSLGSGTAARPIVLRSAGAPATVVSAKCPAISGGGGVVIRDLILRGAGTAKQDGEDGIRLVAPKGGRSAPVRIERVDVAGFGGNGISIGAEKESPDGFDGVRIDHAIVHDNYGTGILTSDGTAFLGKGYAHRNLSIVDCDASGNQDGSGIIVNGVEGGMVEFCRSRGNLGRGGGVGMWAWCARRVTFRHCIASGTRSGGGDGGGFDLDGGCVDCTAEGCLAYDNDGPGFMHCDYPASPRTQRNALRDSVSIDDGRKAKGDSLGFGFVTWGSGLYDCTIERNVALLDVPDAARKETGLLFVAYIRSTGDPVEKQLVRGCVFRNNLVQATGAGALFVRNDLPTRAEGDVRFEKNEYQGALSFFDRKRKVDLGAWRTSYPGDAKPARTVGLGDYRSLAPRDLPNWFRQWGR